jgi:hypothetical protein
MVVGFQCVRWLWNFRVSRGCEIPVSQVVVIFQCLAWLWNSSVSYGCRFPLSHMVVEFQCLTWLYNSSVSRCCGIPDSHMVVGILQPCETLELYSYLRHWNSTAMRYTGISQPCETLEFHNHVRHWKMALNTINQANNYLCNQCLSPLMLRVRISIRARCT